jgi:hypothetical protein
MGLPSGWTEVPASATYRKQWVAMFGTAVPVPREFHHRDGRTALMGREPYGPDDMRWHISVRHGEVNVDGRIPTWDEMVDTAHALRPGVPFVVGVPPRSWWMNVHPHVLHLIETKDQPLIARWREERMGTPPT